MGLMSRLQQKYLEIFTYRNKFKWLSGLHLTKGKKHSDGQNYKGLEKY
jgi:hypothetical protein